MKNMTFDEFWKTYLNEHSKLGTQILHELGSWIVVLGAVASVVTSTWWIAPAAVLLGYLCAFAGHFFIERNLPATFAHPIWAGIANWRVFGLRLRRFAQRARRAGA